MFIMTTTSTLPVQQGYYLIVKIQSFLSRHTYQRLKAQKITRQGEFYRRELPCIQKLIHDHNLAVDTLLVDGFVHLNHQPCLGAKVAEAITSIEKVIGVAKNLHKLMSSDTEVTRSNSRPLYVTETGVGQIEARDFVKSMHGKNRIPTMLKLVDSLCRKELTQGEYRVEELKQGHIRRMVKVG